MEDRTAGNNLGDVVRAPGRGAHALFIVRIPLSKTPTKDSQWNVTRPITIRSPHTPIWPPPHMRRHLPPRRLYRSKPAEAAGQPCHHHRRAPTPRSCTTQQSGCRPAVTSPLRRPVSGGRRRPIPRLERPPPCPVTPMPPMPLSLYYLVPAPAAAASIYSSA
jgi:hypothetical protein